MNKRNKIILLLLIIFITMTGCTKYLSDEKNERIINSKTGQSLPSNVLCQPSDKELLEIYQLNEKRMEYKLSDLPKCENIKIYDSKTYSGLWAQFFVIPLAWLIIQVTSLVQNYGLSVMIVGLLIRIVLMPISIKTMRQSFNMKEAQPELQQLEKKYKDKKDNDSMMRKSQEMMMIYKKYNISPIGSCLMSFIQLPLFLAFLEAINRTPAIFEETLWTFQLGTTPLIGIKDGNYLYILLIVLIILTTYISFKYNMSSVGSPEQQKQMKFMTSFMLVFISVASFSLPSAIALYWIVTNGFAVVQNYVIKKWRS